MAIDRELFDYLTFHLRDTPYDGVANYTRFMITALGLKGFPDAQPLVEGMGLTNDSSIQQKIAEESGRYGDILQINIFDKYVDLSLKVAGLLNWINAYCPLVDFVLKVDDDVYVNVHNLATVLHSLQPSERSVYGHACGGNHPTRNEGYYLPLIQIRLKLGVMLQILIVFDCIRQMGNKL